MVGVVIVASGRARRPPCHSGVHRLAAPLRSSCIGKSLLVATEGEERERREKRREMPITYGSHVRTDDLFFSMCYKKSQV
jgi:hypothetical protein